VVTVIAAGTDAEDTMLAVARLSIRRPWTALVIWSIIAAALVVIGFGVSSSLSPPITVVPGTQSNRAEQLAGAQFGPTQLVPILLEGPTALLNREGPALVKTLAARRSTRVLSAWDAGSASASLRPTPTAAMIVVSIDRSEATTDKVDFPQIQAIVHREILSPLHAFISGQPSLDVAERDASLSDLRRDELIASAIVFMLLLIGLRAPVAAVLVTAVGTVSVLAGFGAVALLGHVISVDPVTVAAGTMSGLALSIAFALLILDRFHHEERLQAGRPRDPAPAARLELEGTGRAVLVAGSVLIVALVLAAVVGPNALFQSVGIGAVICAAFGTGGAVVVMPAALVLLGKRIDAFRVPAPRVAQAAWTRLVNGGNWVTRHAIIAGGLASAILAALAVPALALKTGPESISQLPANSPARIAFNEINQVMGPGYATPYNLIVVANGRPITTPALLASLNRFQLQIAADKTVDSVTGPGAINSTAAQLAQFEPGLNHSVKISDQSKSQLLQLIDGLGRAGAGSKELRSGLESASYGASRLRSGSGSAQSGAAQLHAGLTAAQAGSGTLKAGLGQALSGAQSLKTGASEALVGSSQLLQGISLAQTPATESVPALKSLAADAARTSADIESAAAKLEAMTAGKSDPAYAATLSALESAGTQAAGAKSLAATIAYQAPGLVAALKLLHGGAASLVSGLSKLKTGNARLASGISSLNSGGGQLSSGLTQLGAGAGALQAGLDELTNGAGQLASGLTSGVAPAGELTTGLGAMQAAVTKSRGQIPSTAQIKQLEAESPGLFSSGYFVLAAVAGATRNQRNAATFTINLLRGGSAAQILVVSRYASNDPRTEALGTTLTTLAQQYARLNNVQIAVGGPEGSLGDLTHVTTSKIWADVAVLSVAITLILALALRTLAMPIVATLSSLLGTAATFGILQLLFGGANPPLGGPGYLDPVTLIEIFAASFSIVAVYSTLLLMRRREEQVKGADGPTAIRHSLRATAPALTGAGVAMVAAVIPFAVTDLINVRELGVGIAVAVVIDVLIIRPVLLPAVEMVLVLDWVKRHRRAARSARPDSRPRTTFP
jgi:RND superfamily putative drug exporter